MPTAIGIAISPNFQPDSLGGGAIAVNNFIQQNGSNFVQQDGSSVFLTNS